MVASSVNSASTEIVIFPALGLSSAMDTGAVAIMSSFTFAVALASTLASIAPVVAALALLLAQVSPLPRKAPRPVKSPVPVNNAA